MWLGSMSIWPKLMLLCLVASDSGGKIRSRKKKILICPLLVSLCDSLYITSANICQFKKSREAMKPVFDVASRTRPKNSPPSPRWRRNYEREVFFANKWGHKSCFCFAAISPTTQSEQPTIPIQFTPWQFNQLFSKSNLSKFTWDDNFFSSGRKNYPINQKKERIKIFSWQTFFYLFFLVYWKKKKLQVCF